MVTVYFHRYAKIPMADSISPYQTYKKVQWPVLLWPPRKKELKETLGESTGVSHWHFMATFAVTVMGTWWEHQNTYDWPWGKWVGWCQECTVVTKSKFPPVNRSRIFPEWWGKSRPCPLGGTLLAATHSTTIFHLLLISLYFSLSVFDSFWSGWMEGDKKQVSIFHCLRCYCFSNEPSAPTAPVLESKV